MIKEKQVTALTANVESIAKAAAVAANTATENIYIERLKGYEACLAALDISIDVRGIFNDVYREELGVVAVQVERHVQDAFNGHVPLDGDMGFEENFDVEEDGQF